jgi:hypothetical protein
MELSTRFTNGSLNMSWLEPFIDLNKNLKDYNFYFSKKGYMIKVDFEPKKESENMRYSGHLICNQKDYGIFEMEFTSFGFRLYNTYINGSKKTKVSFRDINEYLKIVNKRNEDCFYYAKGAERLLTIEILNTAAKGRILILDYRVSPIANI